MARWKVVEAQLLINLLVDLRLVLLEILSLGVLTFAFSPEAESILSGFKPER